MTLNYIHKYIDQRASILAPNPVSGQIITAGRTVKPFVTADVTYQVELPWDTKVTATVNNILDEDPPFARLDLNYDPFTASGLGRTYKIAVSKRF